MENDCQSDLKTQEITLCGVRSQQFPGETCYQNSLEPRTSGAHTKEHSNYDEDGNENVKKPKLPSSLLKLPNIRKWSFFPGFR